MEGTNRRRARLWGWAC